MAGRLVTRLPAYALPEVMARQPNIDPDRPDLKLLQQTSINPTVLRATLPEDSLLLRDDPYRVANLFTMKSLFDAKVWWGHKTGSLHKYMRPFIYGHRFDTCIIDLNKTVERLVPALNFLAHVAANPENIILFATFDRQHMHMIEKTADECGHYAHCRRWVPGTFTESNRVFRSEVRLPDVIVMTSLMYLQQKEHPIVVEAAKMCIPTMAVVDTNCDPRLITYPIPGNDDSHAAIELYLHLFKLAIQRGKTKSYDANAPHMAAEFSTPTPEVINKQQRQDVVFKNIISAVDSEVSPQQEYKGANDEQKKRYEFQKLLKKIHSSKTKKSDSD